MPHRRSLGLARPRPSHLSIQPARQHAFLPFGVGCQHEARDSVGVLPEIDRRSRVAAESESNPPQKKEKKREQEAQSQGGLKSGKGDASRENYLIAAGLSRAKAVVITYADTPASF